MSEGNLDNGIVGLSLGNVEGCYSVVFDRTESIWLQISVSQCEPQKVEDGGVTFGIPCIDV